jgi:50S ribosomal protein L16 3-hydroxylase
MIVFNEIDVQTFLNEYWQKKPLLIKQALPDFISPLSPDELAGLSLEEDFESRIIIGQDKNWQLKTGPFTEDTFQNLPEKNWTLLVQGVDRFIDEVTDLIKKFEFIPRWRFDDVMISYASIGGSVGPHFDFYDVFLLQSSGKRRWHLTSKNCDLDNYLKGVDCRIMKNFEVEQTFEVAVGDILYIPPKFGHHGVGLSDDCTTMSFGFRSYSHQEMAEFLEQKNSSKDYYQDPIWQNDKPAFIPQSAIDKTKMSIDEFGCFVTKLDLIDVRNLQNEDFELKNCFDDLPLQLSASCKVAYVGDENNLVVFINGERFLIEKSKAKQMIDFCNFRYK